MKPLPFTNGYYVSETLPLSHQVLINLYVSIPEVPTLTEEQLIGVAGVSQLDTSGEIKEVNRGAWVKGGVAYFVNGTSLYSFDATLTLVELGTVEGTARVSMANNDTQLMILVPGGKGYVYNEGASPAFAEITDSDFIANGAPQYCKYIDGYFAGSTDEKKWIVSALNDGLSWDALDFGSAESDPDEIVGLAVVSNQLYVVGRTTTEGVQNVGGSGFPFQNNNVYLDKGCAAPNTLISTNSTFFMVGNGEREGIAVWQFAGNSFNRVSTTPIETVMQQYSTEELATAFSWSYAAKGAFFVGFTFPDHTFVYNMVTTKWHEQKSTILETQTRWRANSVVSAHGRILVGDAVDGRVGELVPGLNEEYESNIIAEFATQPFTNEGNEITCPLLELTLESGSGNSNVADPQVSMAMSKNGKTYNAERNRSAGKIGEFNRRVIWRRNGRFSRFVTMKFRISDPINRTIMKLEYEG